MSRLATILCPVFFCICLVTLAMPVSGQTPEQDVESADGDEAASTQGVSLTVAPSVIGRNVPGRWSTAAVNGANRTDQDVEETTAVMVGDDSNLQFARRVWIPAGARRQSWLPIKIPADLPAEKIQIDMRSMQLQQSDQGEEEYKTNYLGMSTSKRSLLLSWEQSRTALLIDPMESEDVPQRDLRELNETIYAGRDSVLAGDQDLGMVRLGSSFLPPTGRSLDPIDQMVIADDRILTDTVAVTKIRGWLQRGGRIWVMVDKVSPESVQAILGIAPPYSVVDRVELNDYQFEQAAVLPGGTGARESWSSERPVELLRVLADTDDVHSRIDGWPTAFWHQMGQGEVLFTTLGARGWVENGQGDPTLALKSLSQRFFVNRIDPPTHTAQLVDFLNDDIGYEIPGRAAVGSVLGIHMLVVLVAGAWLAYHKKLHQLAIVVPVTALAATGSLFAIGNSKTSAVPSTIATTEIVRLVAGSSQARVESVAAIYSQETRPLGIRSSFDTTTSVSDADGSGEVRRLLWSDSGESQWLFVTQPPGAIRHVVSDSVITMSVPWSARGKFTASGFQGQITGLDANTCEDVVVVATASPSASVELTAATGELQSGFENVLTSDQYIDAGLMSDVQQDRQDLLRRMITPESPLIDRQPSLLLWTDPINAGVTFDDDYVRRGTTLASIPIHLERVASGSTFQVPASFVRLDSYAGIRGTSTIYNPQTGAWLDEMNKPNESELLCLVPPVLLPCELSRATVRIKMNAPSRTLWIRGLVDGELVTIARRDDPTGVMEFEIDRTDALNLTPEGGLVIGLAVGESDQAPGGETDPEERDDSPNRSTWGIDYVHVNLEGKTQ